MNSHLDSIVSPLPTSKMSYLKLIATLSKFLDENHMENPLVPGVIPSYLMLDEICRQGLALVEKKEAELEHEQNANVHAVYEKTIESIMTKLYKPASQLQEIFYAGDICEWKLFIEGYRKRNGLDPLFYIDDMQEYTSYPTHFNSFPTQDVLTAAIADAFDMAKGEYAVYDQFRSECGKRMQEHGVNAWTPEEREKARLIREQFEYTQNYAYRMIDVLENTYMS